MTGVPSYSTTASENVLANTGINWDEGMAPAQVNNSARQNMADMRTQWNDAAWFLYGNGSKTVAHTYASATTTTIATDVTAYYHVGRRVKAVGSGTGTIYGRISASSYSAPNTTLTYVWDSGSLSNETLTIYASIIPVTGSPLPSGGALEQSNTGVTVGTTMTQVSTITVPVGKWRLSANVRYNGAAGNNIVSACIGATANSSAGTVNGKSLMSGAVYNAGGSGGVSIVGFNVTLAVATAYYLNANLDLGASTCDGFLRADPI
jgi:hypothetical protein